MNGPASLHVVPTKGRGKGFTVCYGEVYISLASLLYSFNVLIIQTGQSVANVFLQASGRSDSPQSNRWNKAKETKSK